MRCQPFVLLVATTFWAIAEGISTPPGSQIYTPYSSTNNLLRRSKLKNYHKIHNEDNDTNEERGTTTSGIETLINSLKLTDDLDDWLKKGESADDVFKFLTLNDAADGLLSNPKLKAWLGYLKQFNEQNPTKKASVITTLTTHYGDDVLAKIIEAGKEVKSTEKFANRLQSELIQHWMGLKKSPNDVFVLLKLDKAKAQLFEQPQIVTWVKYVDDLNAMNPDKQVTLFSTLAARYPEDTLTPMLIAAKNNPTTEKIAVEIQSVQTKLWLGTERKPEDIFKLLQLKQESNIFSSPVFSAWIQYTDDYRKVYFGTTDTAIDTLSKNFGDDVLTMMILEGLSNPSTSKMAKRMEIEQLRNWFIQDNKSPKDIFMALKLYDLRLAVFESPLYTVWTKYTVYIGTVDPSYKASLLTWLLHIYGEENLLKVMRAGMKAPSTKKMVSKFQDEMVKLWLSVDANPVAIHNLLRLDRVGPDDPNRLFYIKYLKAYAFA